MKKSFRIIPKIVGVNCAEIWCLWNHDEDGIIIASVRFPVDGQWNDSMECLQEICTSLKKRIRKSV